MIPSEPGPNSGLPSAPTSYQAGSEPTYVVSGDVTGDCHLDLVAVGQNTHHVTLLQGDGTGGFTVLASQVLTEYLSNPVLADVDGDGLLDVIVVNGADLDVMSSQGSAGLSIPRILVPRVATSGITTYLAAGDFNEDGRTDFAIVYNGIQIVLSEPDGGYGVGPAVTGPYGSKALAVGDMDGDGHLDLIAQTNTGLSAFYGTGLGTFSSPVQMSASLAEAITLGDFDGDGQLDAVVTAYVQNLSVVLNSGGRTFRTVQPGAFVLDPPATAAADLDRDGLTDLFTVGQQGGSFVRGNGDGTFELQPDTWGSHTAPAYVALGDFNEDGNLDVAMANPDPTIDDVTVVLGGAQPPPSLPPMCPGDGGLSSPISVPAGYSTFEFYALDLNGDGQQDILGVSSVLTKVLSQPDSGYARWSNRTISPEQVESSLIADLNGDGRPDLVVGTFNNYAGSLGVALGVSDGGFGPLTLAPVGTPLFDLASGDLNQDGSVDVVAAASNSSRLLLFYGDGNGGFAAPVSLPLGATAIAIGDLTGDGWPDLIAVGTSGQVDVVVNDGGSFGAALADGGVDLNLVSYTALPSLREVALADLDGDGLTDVMACGDSGGVALLASRGCGGPGSWTLMPPTQTLPFYCLNLAVGDLNGDGLPDVVVNRQSPPSLELSFNLGGGMFSTPETIPNTSGGYVRIFDFDGDGRNDLLSSGVQVRFGCPR